MCYLIYTVRRQINPLNKGKHIIPLGVRGVTAKKNYLSDEKLKCYAMLLALLTQHFIVASPFVLFLALGMGASHGWWRKILF